MSLLEAVLEPTARPLLRIVPGEGPIHALGSFLLGAPYAPRGARLPPLAKKTWVCLAQVNFADMPSRPDPDMPDEGILQLYFATGSTMGLDFDAGADGHKGHLVVFWPHPDAALHDHEAAEALRASQADEDLLPLSEPASLAFRRGRQTLLPSDEAARARARPVEREVAALGESAEEEWFEFESGPFTQIGGYAFFTQSDPRDPAQDWVVLLQLDTDDSFGMMWGDAGAASLSIPREALRARDFSQAFFTWDCY